MKLSEMNQIFDDVKGDYHFILQPVSGTVHTTLQKRSGSTFPRLTITSQIDTTTLTLNEKQFQYVLNMISTISAAQDRMHSQLQSIQNKLAKGHIT